MKSEKMMKGLVCHKDGAIELLDMPFPKLEEDTDATVSYTHLDVYKRQNVTLPEWARAAALGSPLWSSWSGCRTAISV